MKRETLSFVTAVFLIGCAKTPDPKIADLEKQLAAQNERIHNIEKRLRDVDGPKASFASESVLDLIKLANQQDLLNQGFASKDSVNRLLEYCTALKEEQALQEKQVLILEDLAGIKPPNAK